jgi:hypothetical protein
MTGLARAYLNRADLLERLRDVVVKLNSSGSSLISIFSSHLPGYVGPGGCGLRVGPVGGPGVIVGVVRGRARLACSDPNPRVAR